MKRLVACVGVMTMLGCGGGNGGTGATAIDSYAGTWGYSDSHTNIRMSLSTANNNFGYDGSIHVDTTDGTGMSDAFGRYSSTTVISPGGRNGYPVTVPLGFHTGSFDSQSFNDTASAPTQYGLLEGAMVNVSKPAPNSDPTYSKLTCSIYVYGESEPVEYALTRR